MTYHVSLHSDAPFFIQEDTNLSDVRIQYVNGRYSMESYKKKTNASKTAYSLKKHKVTYR